MQNTAAHIARLDPTRLPDWRHNRAQWLHDAGRPIQDEEDGVRAACGLLAALEDGTAEDELPDAFEAWKIYENNTQQRWEIEAWLLTGEPSDAIATRLTVGQAVVEAFHQLFFHVRDRLCFRGYVSWRIIEPRTLTGSDVDRLWKFYGYHGGPVVLEAVIDHFQASGKCDYTHLEDIEVVRGSTSRIERSVAIMVLPDNEKNNLAVMQLHAELVREYNSVEHPGDEEQLKQSVDEAVDRAAAKDEESLPQRGNGELSHTGDSPLAAELAPQRSHSNLAGRASSETLPERTVETPLRNDFVVEDILDDLLSREQPPQPSPSEGVADDASTYVPDEQPHGPLGEGTELDEGDVTVERRLQTPPKNAVA